MLFSSLDVEISNFIFHFLIPYIVTSEQMDVNILDLALSNLAILTTFITGMGIVITAVISVGLWLRRAVTRENKEIRKYTESQLEQTKKETKIEIDENRTQIQNVKYDLQKDMKYNTSLITEKLNTHEKVFTEIKSSLGSIVNKMDENIQGYNRNVTRLDTHDQQIDKLQDRVYDNGSSYNNRSRKQNQ